jgi:hypothetical protein
MLSLKCFQSEFVRLTASVLVFGALQGCGVFDAKKNDQPISTAPIYEELETKRRTGYFDRTTPLMGSGDMFAQIQKCYSPTEDISVCDSKNLPFVGGSWENRSAVTVDAILSRTVVSSQWMLTNFRVLLEKLPQEALAQFAPVKYILIKSQQRGSGGHFEYSRAELFINSRALALTPEEIAESDQSWGFRRKSVDQSWGLGGERHKIENHLGATKFVILETEEEKSQLRTAEILFHELGHAWDYVEYSGFRKRRNSNFPSSAVDHDGTWIEGTKVWGAIRRLFEFNLTEEESKAAKNLTAKAFVDYFNASNHITFYSMTSKQEEAAELFAAVMLYKYLGTLRNETVLGFEEGGAVEKTTWRGLGRLFLPQILDRALRNAKTLFPDFDDSKEPFLGIEPLEEGMLSGR